MIIRPLHPPTASANEMPVWDAINAVQSAEFNECWMVPQPAHAALSGEIAAQLLPSAFGELDASVIRAIALHDSGWGTPDAVMIQQARAGTARRKPPRSFIHMPAVDVVGAWSASIETAAKISDLGGVMASEHFRSIGEQGIVRYSGRDRQLLESFLSSESRRQERLRKKLGLSQGKIARLTDALRFCDLLSLYLSCGLQQPVVFPQHVSSAAIHISIHPDSAAISRGVFKSDCLFSISALRYPVVKPAPTSATFSATIRVQ
jgi:hypothetical protein